jgi:hypothetical protein
MKKEDLVALLKLTGVDQNAMALAISCFEIGYDEAKHETLRQSSIFDKEKSDGQNKTEV